MSRPAFIDSRFYTVEEYLEMEEASETRHDYLDGRIFDMAGGSAEHNTIAVNLIGELRQVLKGSSCRVFGLDHRLQDARSTLYTYPDVQIVCGEPEYRPDDKRRTTLTNPKVIIEVLSPSTEAYDRGDKFARYIALPSLVDYLLVSQKSARVDTFHRQGDGTWRFSWVEGLNQTLVVEAVGVTVPLAEIYRDVTFPPPPEVPGPAVPGPATPTPTPTAASV